MADTPATPPQSAPVQNGLEGQGALLIAAIGSLLVSKGLVTSEEWKPLAEAAPIVAGMLYTAWLHWRMKKNADAQKVAGYNAGVVVADATAGPTARTVEPAHVDNAIKAVAAATAVVAPAALNLPSPAALAAAAGPPPTKAMPAPMSPAPAVPQPVPAAPTQGEVTP